MTTGKNMAAATNARRLTDSLGLGRNITVRAAARGAHTVFSLVSSASNSVARQRRSRRATAAMKAPATKMVARGSIAYAIPASHDIKTGGDSMTSIAAINDDPVRSPNI